jgi:hypothetical protein
MSYRFSEMPSGRARRWIRRKEPIPMPWFARPMLILLSLALIGTLTWQGVQYAVHGRQRAAESIATPPVAPSATGQAAWQRDVIVSLDEASRHASEADLAPTEVAVDHAASILTLARVKSQAAPADFFDVIVRKLDEILGAYHQNTRLIEHVTLARIDLAQLRSASEAMPSGVPTALKPTDLLLPNAAAASANPEVNPGSGPQVGDAAASDTNKVAANHVVLRAPRELATSSVLNSDSLGANFLDATNMPSAAEILEPPSSRLFADDVRVEGLTIAGATQTIDGIHWKNVTFIGTRLRYEGGEADLHNVRFIQCMFGFTTDERGARIANAIALGQNTIVIE